MIDGLSRYLGGLNTIGHIGRGGFEKLEPEGKKDGPYSQVKNVR